MKFSPVYCWVVLLFLTCLGNLRSESLPTWIYSAVSNELNGLYFSALDTRNNDVLLSGSFNASRGFVMRLDDSGKVIWRTEATSTQIGAGLYSGGLDVDANGNAVVMFQFNGTLTVGNLKFINDNTSKAFVVAKLGADGNALWGRMVYGARVTLSYREGQVHFDKDGNVFLFADHTEGLGVPFEGGGLTSSPDPYGKTTLIRFSPIGLPEWIRGYDSGGAQGYVRFDSFTLNSTSIFVAGFFNKAVNWGSTNLTAGTPTGFIGRIAKNLGTPEWIYSTGPRAQGSSMTLAGDQAFWVNTAELNGSSLLKMDASGHPLLKRDGPGASSKIRTVTSGDLLAAGVAPAMFSRYSSEGLLQYAAPLAGSNIISVSSGVGYEVNPRGDFYFSGKVGGEFGANAFAKISVPGLFPEITRQPVASTNQPNTFLSFGASIAAVGAQPLSFQWRQNGAPIPGATSSNLLRENLTPTDSGNYDCVVSNPYGAVITRAHPVRVIPPVTFGKAPVPQLVIIPGITLFGEAILASDVTPSGLSQKILTCTITNSSAGWPGSGSFDFQFNATGSFNGSYQFAPSGVFGSVANSYNLAFNGLGALYLLLNRFPVAPTNSVIRLYSEGIYSLEASPIGNRGTSRGVYTIQGGTNTAQFIVVATAMPGVSSLTYQWQRDGIDLSNATNSVLNLLAVTAPDDGEYRCMVVAYNGDRTLSVPIPTISARLHVIAGSVRSDPSLQFTVSNGRLTLSWPVGFKLQRTLQLNPPDWTDEPELSPAEIPTNESGAFYRLIAQ